jgi:hypothetical protein
MGVLSDGVLDAPAGVVDQSRLDHAARQHHA